jgi:hypothetical protein
MEHVTGAAEYGSTMFDQFYFVIKPTSFLVFPLFFVDVHYFIMVVFFGHVLFQIKGVNHDACCKDYIMFMDRNCFCLLLPNCIKFVCFHRALLLYPKKKK